MRLVLAGGLFAALAAYSQSRIIVFGAHPDDCDIGFAGSAAKLAAAGHKVKFVSITNGDAGHQTLGGGALAVRRLNEAKESGRRLGVEYDVLENHDGELLPSLNVRFQVIRKIREWNADVVISPRPNDYHPDHRYTGVLVQDAAYMVVVPNVTPETPPLKKNPVFLYLQDRFQRPNPFRPDIAISIDDVFDKKINALDAHESQVYEWLPWVDGEFDQVPKDKVARKEWLKKRYQRRVPNAEVRKSLIKWYGEERGSKIQWAESLEICEYGKQPTEAEIRTLFPILGK
jgi:LmbE family N-acetylglucosaminyl deacetylase